MCALLRGEAAEWPFMHIEGVEDEFVRRSDYQGVTGLLNERLGKVPRWPVSLLQTLHRHAVAHTMWDIRHQLVITQLVEAFARAKIPAVLIKGTALAHTLYREPAQRQRGDTDVFVAPDDRQRAVAALVAMGLTQDWGVSGDSVSYQSSHALLASDGSDHSIDLHWRINNSELLSRLFTFEELLERAIPIPRLGADARGHGMVDALLLALMHRATHRNNPYYAHGTPHYGANRLIWLYDIHLLANRLQAPDWRQFVDLARAKQLLGTCADGFHEARKRFETSIPGFVDRALLRPGSSELVTRYLTGSSLEQQWMDFAAIESGAGKLAFLRELIFPSAGYVRDKYAEARVGWLPWLYARRAGEGAIKRLARPRSNGI